jgi:hypothetical protein
MVRIHGGPRKVQNVRQRAFQVLPKFHHPICPSSIDGEDEDELSDGEGSVHVPSEKDSENSSEEMVEKKVTRKRISKVSLRQGGEPLAKRNKTTKDVAPKKAATSKMKHTTESVLQTYKDDTEYGQSFCRMTTIEQRAEV